jgi:hypothetical protein
MSGPDLKVDYELLEGSGRTLSQMQSQLENLSDWSHSTEGCWGSGEIASAMSDHFAGNWNSHRKRMIEAMKSLSELCEKSVKEFRELDSKQAHELTAHGN